MAGGSRAVAWCRRRRYDTAKGWWFRATRGHRVRGALCPAASQESGTDKWRGQAWLFSGNEPWKLFADEQQWARGDFPALISDLLDRVSALELPYERTTVGFMVPRALLVEAMDNWSRQSIRARTADWRDPSRHRSLG